MASATTSTTKMTRSRNLLFIDIETYSETDLKTCGVYRYVDDPAFEVMLFAYAYNDDPVDVVDFACGESLPSKVLADLANPRVIKIAHNANFERTCLTKWLDTYMDPAQWECTAVKASTLGLPRSLENVGKVLGLKEDERKMAIGKRLIMYFSRPCAPTKTNGRRTRNLPRHEPEKWALYKEYNKQDVVTERAIFHVMESAPETIPEEHALWCLDQKINEGGVLIDTTLVENILHYSEQYSDRLETRARQISGIDNPSSFQQIRKWLRSKHLDPPSLDKDGVKQLISECRESEPDVVEFMQIRQELGKTSVAKYDAMARALCHDKRIRGMLQFYGAERTGRWAGRIVQLQNLPQNKLKDLDLVHQIVRNGDFDLLEILYESPMDLFSQLIRTSFIARKGKTFAVADYSAIEARVIAWLAGEEWRLEVFRTHGKMGGEAMGLTEDEMQHIVNVWRGSNSKITELWRTTENSAKKAIAHPGVSITIQHGITFQMLDGTLYITLPSGRALAYQKARIERIGMRSSIKYMGQTPETKKWETVDTYGGKITENITQAVARDCLGAAMLRLDKAGYTPQFHVHDEVIVEVDQDSAETDMERIRDIMRLKDVDWLKGLPLNAEGYLTTYYKKD